MFSLASIPELTSPPWCCETQRLLLVCTQQVGEEEEEHDAIVSAPTGLMDGGSRSPVLCPMLFVQYKQ